MTAASTRNAHLDGCLLLGGFGQQAEHRQTDKESIRRGVGGPPNQSERNRKSDPASTAYSSSAVLTTLARRRARNHQIPAVSTH